MHSLGSFTLSIAGLEELPGYEARSVSHVVSLIDPDEPTPPSVQRMADANRFMLRLHDLIDAHSHLRAPDRGDVEALIAHSESLRGAPIGHLLVHCHMGRSRSTAAAAVMLHVLQAGAPDEIFAHIASVRDPIWPNSRILTFADEILGTGGLLLEACRPVYQDVAKRHEQWIAPFATSSRMRDLQDAGLVPPPDAPDLPIKD